MIWTGIELASLNCDLCLSEPLLSFEGIHEGFDYSQTLMVILSCENKVIRPQHYVDV